MPSRTLIPIEDVASLDNLVRAFHRAALGKRTRRDVRAFGAQLWPELHRLQKEILDGTVPVGELRSFEIHDPKRRRIHAPCFRERVLHHALMAKVGPALDRALVADTFACRSGKGSLAAVLRAQRHVRKWKWFAKIDVASYFASIDHEVLLALIERRIRGRGVLELCRRIVGSFGTEPGKGLPIGALTSQHFANTYLSLLDRFLLEDRRVGGMVRYMDDAVWWCREKTAALELIEEARAFLAVRLRLTMKPLWQVQRSDRGLTLCGFRIFPHRLRLTARRRRRYTQARRKWELAHGLGLITDRELQAGVGSALAITAHAEARGWRRRELERRPPPDV